MSDGTGTASRWNWEGKIVNLMLVGVSTEIRNRFTEPWIDKPSFYSDTGIPCCAPYNMVISLGGKVRRLSRTSIMFSTCMAMTRHNSRPWRQTHSNEWAVAEWKKKECVLKSGAVPALTAAGPLAVSSCPPQWCRRRGSWFQRWASGCGWPAPPPAGPLPSVPAMQTEGKTHTVHAQFSCFNTLHPKLLPIVLDSPLHGSSHPLLCECVCERVNAVKALCKCRPCLRQKEGRNVHVNGYLHVCSCAKNAGRVDWRTECRERRRRWSCCCGCRRRRSRTWGRRWSGLRTSGKERESTSEHNIILYWSYTQINHLIVSLFKLFSRQFFWTESLETIYLSIIHPYIYLSIYLSIQGTVQRERVGAVWNC